MAHFNYNGGGGHEYVNLGLPSGRLWATCNIGATCDIGKRIAVDDTGITSAISSSCIA